MLAGPPQTPVAIPDAVESLINGRTFEVVWLNGLGGLTFRIEDTTSSVYVKWLPVASEVDVADEIEKLRWASAYTPVPTLIDQGFDSEGSWIVTESIDAENAVSKRVAPMSGPPRNACVKSDYVSKMVRLTTTSGARASRV